MINAAGIWGQNICEYADLNIKMFPAKGSLLILDYRINNLVINRCRKPSDADILVPGDTISLIGTTSEHIDYDQIDNLHVTEREVDILLAEGAKLAPIMANTRVLRAYAGVRHWSQWTMMAVAVISVVALFCWITSSVTA